MNTNTMKTAIYYHTGSGNSLWVARKLAQNLDNAQLVSLVNWKPGDQPTPTKAVGVVFPIHWWGVTARILEFIKELNSLQPEYIFAIAVDGGQVANSLIQLKRVIKKQNLSLSSGYEIVMPSNYTPLGGPGSIEAQNKCFELADIKIKLISDSIRQLEEKPVERGPLWQRVIFTWMYNLNYPKFNNLDKHFRIGGDCNSCGICSKVCPSQNISLVKGRPIWNHRCEQCFACLQWCPKEAIQYGSKTAKYPRYHNPEISLKDMLNQNGINRA